MNITFSDSFWKSLKRLSRHQTWWYKTYNFFRRDLPYFLENIWFFRKELWSFRSWDYTYNLQMFRRSLEKTANTIEFYGIEIDSSRLKKVEKIKRVIYLLDRIKTDNYLSDAEKELGEIKNIGWDERDDSPEEREHNRKVFDRASEIETSEFDELLTILKGQNHKEYKSLYDSQSEEDIKKKDLWYEWFDGSGIKGWWD